MNFGNDVNQWDERERERWERNSVLLYFCNWYFLLEDLTWMMPRVCGLRPNHVNLMFLCLWFLILCARDYRSHSVVRLSVGNLIPNMWYQSYGDGSVFECSRWRRCRVGGDRRRHQGKEKRGKKSNLLQWKDRLLSHRSRWSHRGSWMIRSGCMQGWQ